MALSTCDALAALLTPDFHQSSWTDQEIGVAMGRGVLIVPVRLGIDPYGFIGKFQGLQGVNKTPAFMAEEITRILIRNKQTEKQTGKSLVASLEVSSSFQMSKDIMSILEETQWLDDQLIDKLKSAVERNGQVSHSFGVPTRVEELIRRFQG